MFKVVILLFIFVSSLAKASPQLVLKNPNQYPFDQQKLEEQFKVAYTEFEKEIGELQGVITLTVSPASCLRTGYNRESREVEFCPGKNVINAGLDSVDIINHELFHSFICSYDVNLCDMQEKDYLHEALADTFAYNLQSDDVFGENFYKNQFFLRKYKSTFRAGLVQGEHEKGNALSAQFIREKTPLIKLLPLFQEADPKDEVEYTVIGAPYSKLNRYRLPLNQSIQMQFTFAEEASVSEVEWTVPQGIEIESGENFNVTIKITAEPESSKGFAIFKSAEGEILGRRAFYFGLKKN